MVRHSGCFRGMTIVAVLLAVALSGCGGGVGSVGGGGQQTNPQYVGVSGAVNSGTGGSGSPSRLSPQPRAAGSTPFANATVRAIDYGTGQPHDFSPPEYTDSNGRYEVDLPKGRDFILFFEKTVSGKTERLSVVVPKTSAGQVVNADFGTSLVAEAVAATAGQLRSLSGAWVDNLTSSVATYIASLSLTDNTFTPGQTGALIGIHTGDGLNKTNTNASSIQTTIENLIKNVLVPPPGKPAQVAVTPGDGQVTLTWAAVDNATKYHVYRATSDNVSRFLHTYTVTVTDNSATDTTVANGTTYYYVVTAEGAGGEGAESAMVSAKPQAPAPGAPTGVTATPGDGKITISWTAVPGAASYNVYWSTSDNVSTTGGTKITCDNTTTQKVVEGLTNGTTYYFVVTVVKSGSESNRSLMVSAAPEYVPPAAGLADAKAMVASLRNTAQSITNYRGGSTPGNGLIDNAAGVLTAKIDNAVKPFFTNFANSLQTFTTPAFRAIGEMSTYPSGAAWSWDGYNLLFQTSRTDNKWVVTTTAGMTITLTKSAPAAGDYSPVNFTATSSSDNVLDYHGSFDNVVTKSVTINGTSVTLVSSADMTASFVDSAIGAGNTTTISAHLQVDLNDSNDITGFRIGFGFVSPVIKGSTQLVVTGLIPYAEYSSSSTITRSPQVSQIKLTSASLEVVGAGRFDGNFQIDLTPSKFTRESFAVTDGYSNTGGITLSWDERGATPKLLDVEGGAPEVGLWRYRSEPPTVSGNTWTLTKKDGSGSNWMVYTITVSGTGTARAISGTVRVHLWGSDWTNTISTIRYKAKGAMFAIPTTATFFGSYTNLDSSVPLDNVTGSITATFRNPQAADPFIVTNYEVYDVLKDNFPRVQVVFTGTIKPTGAAPITGQVTSENRFVAKGTAGLPDATYDYIVVDGTTNYTGGTETINGTAKVYARMDVANSYGDRAVSNRRASLSLVNAKGITFNLAWEKESGVTGTVANSTGTLLGVLDLTRDVPILRWVDGTLESLP